ncbi:Chromosome partition protein MukB [Bienertia sinuspersici]
MATIDDNMKEDSVHSHLMNSLISNLNEEALSPEDVAWADSCLIKDADVSAADWSSIKDALLEILSSQPEPQPNSSVPQSSTQLTTADEILRFSEDFTSVEFGGEFSNDTDFVDDDFGEVESIDISEDVEDDLIFRNKRRQKRGKVLGNIFRPNYSEDVKIEDIDSELNSSLTAHELGSSLDDIFKVWDLAITEEQDDFTKQLDKALGDVPPQSLADVDDSTTAKDLFHVSIDDLIAGVSDLSLKQNKN